MMEFLIKILMLDMIFCLISYIFNRKNVIMMLISIEFMSLLIFLMLFFYLLFFNIEMYYLMIYLCFCVSEGVMGLCILVSMIRSHGNDLIYSLSFLKC